MKVKELMRPPLACRPSTDLATAARLMRYGDCGFLPVVGHDNEVVGSITDRDVSMALASQHVSAMDLKVESIMNSDVPSCPEEDTIEDAMSLMRDCHSRHLPVTNPEGRLHGVLSINDLVLAARESAGHGLCFDDVVETLKGIGRHRRVERLL